MTKPWVMGTLVLLWIIGLTWGLSAQEGPSLKEGPEVCLTKPRRKVCQSFKVYKIKVLGASRTKRYVVTREVLFKEGQYTSVRQVNESARRLLNLGVFRLVDWSMVKSTESEGAFDVHFHVDERWTLLPNFRLSRGGGLTSFSTGLSDINFLGRYLGWGVFYSRLAEDDKFLSLDGAQNSWSVLLRDPRFLDTQVRLSLSGGIGSRGRVLYSDSGGVTGGFSRRRTSAAVSAVYEWFWWLYGGATLGFSQDRYSYGFFSPKLQEVQRTNFGGLPESQHLLTLATFLRFGRVNQEDFYFSGEDWTQTWSHANEGLGSTLSLTRMTSTARAYRRLGWRGNLAVRLSAGTSDARLPEYQYFLGGLSQVRGYPDSFFRGASYWSGNVEYRVAPFVSKWFALQVLGFTDLGGVSDAPFALGNFDAMSMGVGVRLISPKIYRTVARFDYAWPLFKGVPGGLSFGAQQFF